ncbi:hypothetical protein BKA70DRAFT_1239699 [Coprinopsis sp. MPI-PUGE-AT-0042]|nr:hypothetical protein BKA70DRAFT_1239699 [Coprinopsis sp. MPI-PUGE-AT-0042]
MALTPPRRFMYFYYDVELQLLSTLPPCRDPEMLSLGPSLPLEIIDNIVLATAALDAGDTLLRCALTSRDLCSIARRHFFSGNPGLTYIQIKIGVAFEGSDTLFKKGTSIHFSHPRIGDPECLGSNVDGLFIPKYVAIRAGLDSPWTAPGQLCFTV